MPTVEFTSVAKRDLRQITEHIAFDNPSAALSWQSQIQSTCDLLATQPAMGQRIKARRLGIVRRHTLGNYLIYYRPISDGVEILMVVHGARDQDKLL